MIKRSDDQQIIASTYQIKQKKIIEICHLFRKMRITVIDYRYSIGALIGAETLGFRRRVLCPYESLHLVDRRQRQRAEIRVGLCGAGDSALDAGEHDCGRGDGA